MLTLGNYVQAAVVSFGSGTIQFNMEFVTIGNPGNAADTTGIPIPAGSVGYSYGIGKYEVSRDMVNKYNLNFGSANLQIINMWDASGFGGNGDNQPAVGVGWNAAARFVNWLNTSTGRFAPYRFNSNIVGDYIALWTSADIEDYDPENPYRSKRATFVLPTYHEWYKAAYYQPDSNTYSDYTNGRNTPPAAVTAGTGTNEAVFNHTEGQGPARVDRAGGANQFGVVGMGGNVAEWEESPFGLSNMIATAPRGWRGGHWMSPSGQLSSSERYEYVDINLASPFIGFRVVQLSVSDSAVPEPTSMAIFGLGALGMAYRARRKSKA